MPNFKSVVYFLVVDFGGGCRRSCCCCCCSCDMGKTKSTPCPFDLRMDLDGVFLHTRCGCYMNGMWLVYEYGHLIGLIDRFIDKIP